MAVLVNFPEEIKNILKTKNVNKEIMILTAIELYRENKVSLGKASEIANISIKEFLYELRKRGVPLNYDLEELKKDIEMVEKL